MSEEAPNPLPFSETTHTTLAAAIEARQLLADQLLPELARPITSLSYNPWIAKRRDDKQEYETDSEGGFIHEYSVGAIYLFTEPIPTGLKMVTPKRIIFQTRAADQGWATFGGEGTFENSHTWFEASILRPIDTAHDGAHVLPESILQQTWWGPAGARSHLNKLGWDFVEVEDGELTWTVCCNITASSEYRNYRVEWELDVEPEIDDEDAVGDGYGFLELLEPGCIVALWARAEQAHWVNKVAAATIEIEYDFL
ncbi:uncharacterized protein NECHADRAFT_86792 [Fusarium vanettenii 77-13-4]|uniref:Uncharacterized protein n=1 Tax=Fusarium vanettenii (strain ATCC MYA-4622 / CBS 123669 / FGSC 9596 / NRRL 45880 / 77-13-4) TaxID=660122 RepID=C7ZK30_FUSV7|nr:uncharacterized protein NECHADRAFT_86792 [Fusarium vanettenii 77-13-4]EEU35566.1 hypothetical protein NECHADRAFT_86792 [Fusarium vanettenii 77-13-4]